MIKMLFTKENCFEVNGELYEKENAFPSKKGDQNAIMLKWNGKNWEMSGWNAWVDSQDTVANGWEALREGEQGVILFAVGELMDIIEKGE